MFDQVEDQHQKSPWGMLGGLLAFAALLVAGYFLVS